MFELKGVKYKDILDIDYLEIPDHSVTCIVGESGSGKTTLLKHLNNLISCDSGQILYKGQDIETLDPIKLRRQVAMLPQNPILFAGNIRDNLSIGLKFAERPPATDRQLREYMNMMRLHKGLDDDTDKLSGGEKQRLCLIRLLLLEPEVLLLDEPSSALDEDTEHLVIEQVVEYIKKNRKTLVMVTHARNIAQEYGELIVTIDRGRVVNAERRKVS